MTTGLHTWLNEQTGSISLKLEPYPVNLVPTSCCESRHRHDLRLPYQLLGDAHMSPFRTMLESSAYRGSASPAAAEDSDTGAGAGIRIGIGIGSFSEAALVVATAPCTAGSFDGIGRRGRVVA